MIRKSKKAKVRHKAVKELDAEARMETLERDEFKCVGPNKDGSRCNKPNPQWAHVLSRRHPCLRWDSDNALSLCAYHHRWWHSYPTLSAEWFRSAYPERHKRIHEILLQNPKVNPVTLLAERQTSNLPSG